MKVCVCMDGNGHFDLAKLENRKEVLDLLKVIHDGDYWENTYEDSLEEVDLELESDLFEIDDDKWVEFVQTFEQRGTMEIIVLNI
jgi:hypothetical protein